ncbi:hypothetical protein BANRA_00232 [Acinetobacter baumannii]|nr:hypothetical protein BANRA_02586 [Acinetobacter baumannii]VDA09098.1 hypothetical protein BANRA_00232 [Acinetobacter baumannii]
MADRSLQPTSIFVQRWQPDVLQQTDGAGSVQSKHQHSTNYDNQSLSLEEAWHFSPAWMQDLNGEDGATSASNQQLEKFNQNLSAYYDAQSKQFIAKPQYEIHKLAIGLNSMNTLKLISMKAQIKSFNHR